MGAAIRDSAFGAEERTSGIYPTSRATNVSRALDELRGITGEKDVAVLFFATQVRAPAGAAYPPRSKRLEGAYSLTHRLVSWLTGFTRACAADVPSYLAPWFPSTSVVVVPICTPDWHAGSFVVTRASVVHAREIRSLAADLALRLEQDDRRARLATLGSSNRTA
jgi:hypothetical protein